MVDALIGEYSQEALVQVEPLTSGENIYQKALQLHDTFDAQVWKRQPSFHNKFHIESLHQAFTPLFEKRNESDPLEIRENLDTWNKRHPNAPIREEELPEVFTIAIACHDLGNILEQENFNADSNGQLEFQFLQAGYTAAGAEDRSKIIAERLIEATTFTTSNETLASKQERYSTFVKHIIDQTKFVKNPQTLEFPTDETFRTITETLDQVGTHFFRSDRNRNPVKGLLLEMNEENLRVRAKDLQVKPLIIGNPTNFVNWVESQFPKLVPDAEKRSEIKRIWNKSAPSRWEGFDSQPLPAAEVLKNPALTVLSHH